MFAGGGTRKVLKRKTLLDRALKNKRDRSKVIATGGFKRGCDEEVS